MMLQTLRNVLRRGRRGIDMIEILLGLAILGVIVAAVFQLLGGAIKDFATETIGTLFH